MRDQFGWARLLAFVTGLVNQELLLRNEYLAAENRILRAHLPARLRWSDAERSTLAEIAKRLGRKALQEIARVAKPDTLLAWYGLYQRSCNQPQKIKRRSGIQHRRGLWSLNPHLQILQTARVVSQLLRPDANGIQRYPCRHVQQKATVGVHMPE